MKAKGTVTALPLASLCLAAGVTARVPHLSAKVTTHEGVRRVADTLTGRSLLEGEAVAAVLHLALFDDCDRPPELRMFAGVVSCPQDRIGQVLPDGLGPSVANRESPKPRKAASGQRKTEPHTDTKDEAADEKARETFQRDRWHDPVSDYIVELLRPREITRAGSHGKAHEVTAQILRFRWLDVEFKIPDDVSSEKAQPGQKTPPGDESGMVLLPSPLDDLASMMASLPAAVAPLPLTVDGWQFPVPGTLSLATVLEVPRTVDAADAFPGDTLAERLRTAIIEGCTAVWNRTVTMSGSTGAVNAPPAVRQRLIADGLVTGKRWDSVVTAMHNEKAHLPGYALIRSIHQLCENADEKYDTIVRNLQIPWSGFGEALTSPQYVALDRIRVLAARVLDAILRAAGALRTSPDLALTDFCPQVPPSPRSEQLWRIAYGLHAFKLNPPEETPPAMRDGIDWIHAQVDRWAGKRERGKKVPAERSVAAPMPADGTAPEAAARERLAELARVADVDEWLSRVASASALPLGEWCGRWGEFQNLPVARQVMAAWSSWGGEAAPSRAALPAFHAPVATDRGACFASLTHCWVTDGSLTLVEWVLLRFLWEYGVVDFPINRSSKPSGALTFFADRMNRWTDRDLLDFTVLLDGETVSVEQLLDDCDSKAPFSLFEMEAGLFLLKRYGLRRIRWLLDRESWRLRQEKRRVAAAEPCMAMFAEERYLSQTAESGAAGAIACWAAGAAAGSALDGFPFDDRTSPLILRRTIAFFWERDAPAFDQEPDARAAR